MRISSKNMGGYHWAVDEGIEGYLMTEPMLFKESVKIQTYFIFPKNLEEKHLYITKSVITSFSTIKEPF